MRSQILLRTILFFFWLVFSRHASAQLQAKIDSMKLLLPTAKEDTNKVKLLSSISFSYKDLNAEEGLNYGRQAIELSEKLNWQSGTAKALNSVGHIYRVQRDYNQALEYFSNALKVMERIGDKQGTAMTLNNIAITYKATENYSKSLEYQLKSRKIYDEIGDKRALGGSSTNIGLLYRSLEDYDKSLEYLLAGLQIARDFNDANAVVGNLINVGHTYKEQRKFDEALKCFTEANELNKTVGNKRWQTANIGGFGDIYWRKGDYSKAIDYFLQVIDMHKAASDMSGVAMYKDRLATVYLEALRDDKLPSGVTREEAIDKAKLYLSEATEMAKKQNFTHLIASTYQVQSELAEYLGSYKEALENYKSFRVIRDSLLNSDKTNEIKQKIVQYEFAKREDSLKFQQRLIEAQLIQQTLLAAQHQRDLRLKQNELALANKEKELHSLEQSKMKVELMAEQGRSRENEKQLIIAAQEGDLQKAKLSLTKFELQRQRIILYLGTGLFGLLVIFLIVYFNNRRKLHMERLRNKISRDLHDEVGSALSSVSLMNEMAIRGKDNAMMRYSISESLLRAQNAMSEIVWMLNSRNDSMDNLVLRIGEVARETLELKGINYRLDVTGEVGRAKISMEKRREIFLVLKECLNNIIKYADCTDVTIELNASSKMLHMKVSDNGRGFDPAIATTGNGLHNMKGRALVLKGSVGVNTAPGMGTRVELAVPLT